jgi:hypothetical protein
MEQYCVSYRNVIYVNWFENNKMRMLNAEMVIGIVFSLIILKR